MSTKLDENGNPVPENGSETPLNPEDPNNPTPSPSDSPPAGSGTPMEFNHPLLKGKTPEEIERILVLQQQTVNEQARTLNRLAERGNVEQGRPKPGTESVNDAEEDKKFWESPTKRLRAMLQETVEPIQRELNTMKSDVRAPSIRDSFRAKYPEFTELESMIDAALINFGLENPKAADENMLEAVFHTVYGKAVYNGQIAPRGRENPNPNNPNPPAGRQQVTIPQHRPSPAPLPNNPGNAAPKLRELSENERRLAREFFGHLPTDAERHKAYIEFQELDEEEVANSTIGKRA